MCMPLYMLKTLEMCEKTSFFSQKGELCKQWNLKVDRIKYVFKIWLTRSEKAPS